ncbi:hypothetical protein HYPSUDRAFT_141882 [Hypholoma sublateritium FD-334 SS-4]|uniref:FAD-binding domain-containing protein n=1 Tax=Hypholoma sublateritium (strain FD-334 SS-4) TaxID=945553 RepID=A0A0D2PLH6_HYPSF|nr:hypothetical protein HYPSUDRAFT_141882 [Hypholoma sublateritium FD-334 SS-4]
MIWARTWHILARMGLTDAFARIAHAPPTGAPGVGFDYRRSDQPAEGFRFKLVEMPYGCIRFHRAAFLDVFVSHLPPGIAYFGKRLATYSRGGDGETALLFSDGSTATCDVLIGADGIKSTVRAQMYAEAAEAAGDFTLMRHVEPVWTGTMAYRGLIRAQDVPRNEDGMAHRAFAAPMMYCGKSKHVVSYSIAQGDIVNVVTFASQPEKHGYPFNGEWVVDCEQQELLDCYAGWEPEVFTPFQCIDKPTRWAIHHLRPLPFYHRNGVVLMGDAAHAMSPHQGAGAGQAIEDAFVLGNLLAEAPRDQVLRYLGAYEAVRLPAANGVLTGSYESGMMYEFDSEYGDKYETLGPAIAAQWAWIDQVPLDEELASALRLARQPARSSRL